MTSDEKKIISLTCSKNEDDIIESFVRINSRVIDIFVFIDDSTDRTKEILKILSAEGFSIIIMSHNVEPAFYRQSNLITDARRALFNQFEDAIFIPLDCDEFPEFSKVELLEKLKNVQAGYAPVMFWRTYVPVGNGFPGSVGLVDGFLSREPEGNEFFKVIVSNCFPIDTIIDEGSHLLLTQEGRVIPSIDINLRLAHFPVRSTTQIAIKNITAVIKVARTTIKNPGEGYHIYPVLTKLVNDNFSLETIKLQELSIGYANKSRETISFSLGAPPPIPKCELKHTRASEISLNAFLGAKLVELLTDPIRKDSANEIIAGLKM